LTTQKNKSMVVSIHVRHRPFPNKYFDNADHVAQQITDMVMSAYEDNQPLPIVYSGIWGPDAQGDNIAQQVIQALNEAQIFTSEGLQASYSQTTDEVSNRVYDVITVIKT